MNAEASSTMRGSTNRELSPKASRRTGGNFGRRALALGRLLSALPFLLAFVGAAHAAQWAKSYGGTREDSANSIQLTADGGYIVGGYTQSFDPARSAWLLKLDGDGNVAWQETLGDTFSFAVVQPTADGGYIAVGGTDSNWVLKLDGNGSVVWQKSYAGINAFFHAVQPTPDGGYITAGSSYAMGTLRDALVMKLDAGGNISWQTIYRGNISEDTADTLQPTADGGYIVGGYTGSFGPGSPWLLKLDASGNIDWQKTIGGTGIDFTSRVSVKSVRPTVDGGYIVASRTSVGSEAGVLKLDASGNITWQRTLGSGQFYGANSVQPTADGGYVVAGYAPPFAPCAGKFTDAWILKLDASGNVVWQRAFGGGCGASSANSVQPTADGGYIVAGYTAAFGAGSVDAWVLKLDADGAIAGCAAMGASGATSATSNATMENSSAIVLAGSATTASSGVTPSNTTAAVRQQCYSSGLASAAIPALSKWGMIVLSALLGLWGVLMLRRDESERVDFRGA